MKSTTHSKAVLAVLFAGGLFTSPPPCLSAENIENTSTDAQEILNDQQLTPELRAYNLLRLASRLLGDNTKAVKINHSSRMKEQAYLNTWQSFLILWTNQVAYANHELKKNNSLSADDCENSALAKSTINQALKQLDASSDTFAKLNLYYIASLLDERAGNLIGKNRCDHVLEDAFKSCEGSGSVDEDAIKAARSILNASAYGFIQLQIDDAPVEAKSFHQLPRVDESSKYLYAENFSENDFKESESLKLRAIRMVDRLKTTSHERRKAHRDLALWYSQLGKADKAKEQKEILFELVGVREDSILYPQIGGCGSSPIWWQPSQNFIGMDCGMG